MSVQYGVAIGFFTFNRLDTTSAVFEEIRKVKPERLYLISDGAREDRAGEKEKVEEVRTYIESHIDWPCQVKKNYADSNMGCKKRMASGISWLLENEEMAIIIEDDVKPSEDFFPYMEEILNRYKDDERVMLVSGFKLVTSYPVDESYTFSHFPMIWGWGTWRRAWAKYDIDIKEWETKKKDKSLRKRFNFWGYLKYSADFDSVFSHQKDTWDFQWAFTVLSNDGLAVIPGVNLIENLGFGRADATHTTGNTDQDFTTYPIPKPYKHPEKVEANSGYDKAYLKNGWGTAAICKKVLRRLKLIK
ncbi:MAG: hypothetical protein IJ589_05045 [Lachnospiraceae bacterium]|nr:hypothetical protein [Lachnospiraceae bacterium]